MTSEEALKALEAACADRRLPDGCTVAIAEGISRVQAAALALVREALEKTK